MLILIGVVIVIALLMGGLLAFASIKFKVQSNPLVEQLDNLLPQSQCGQCGYAGCFPYAEAIINNNAPINLCTPGGEAVCAKIAELLGVDTPSEKPSEKDSNNSLPLVAFIHEEQCIGCTKCLQVCPVDAIIGTNKMVHTVIGELCTGCKLCVAPCPTDCITMEPIAITVENWDWRNVVARD